MNRLYDQHDKILSNLVIIDRELFLRAYKLNVKLVIILIYLVLNVVEGQNILL